MNSTIFISVCSLFYCLLLIVILCSNKNKNTGEKKIFMSLVIINFLTLICETSGLFLGNNYNKYNLLNDITLKLMLVFYVMWLSVFIIFIFNLSKKETDSNKKKNIIICLIAVIVSIVVIILPIKYNLNSNGVIIYSSGPAVQFVYYYVMACSMICLLIMFNSIKRIKIRNYASLFALIILLTISAVIQSYYPYVLLCASIETFVMYIAYNNIRAKEIELKAVKNIENVEKQ